MVIGAAFSVAVIVVAAAIKIAIIVAVIGFVIAGRFGNATTVAWNARPAFAVSLAAVQRGELVDVLHQHLVGVPLVVQVPTRGLHELHHGHHVTGQQVTTHAQRPQHLAFTFRLMTQLSRCGSWKGELCL